MFQCINTVHKVKVCSQADTHGKINQFRVRAGQSRINQARPRMSHVTVPLIHLDLPFTFTFTYLDAIPANRQPAEWTTSNHSPLCSEAQRPPLGQHGTHPTAPTPVQVPLWPSALESAAVCRPTRGLTPLRPLHLSLSPHRPCRVYRPYRISLAHRLGR